MKHIAEQEVKNAPNQHSTREIVPLISKIQERHRHWIDGPAQPLLRDEPPYVQKAAEAARSHPISWDTGAVSAALFRDAAAVPGPSRAPAAAGPIPRQARKSPPVPSGLNKDDAVVINDKDNVSSSSDDEEVAPPRPVRSQGHAAATTSPRRQPVSSVPDPGDGWRDELEGRRFGTDNKLYEDLTNRERAFVNQKFDEHQAQARSRVQGEATAPPPALPDIATPTARPLHNDDPTSESSMPIRPHQFWHPLDINGFYLELLGRPFAIGDAGRWLYQDLPDRIRRDVHVEINRQWAEMRERDADAAAPLPRRVWRPHPVTYTDRSADEPYLAHRFYIEWEDTEFTLGTGAFQIVFPYTSLTVRQRHLVYLAVNKQVAARALRAGRAGLAPEEHWVLEEGRYWPLSDEGMSVLTPEGGLVFPEPLHLAGPLGEML